MKLSEGVSVGGKNPKGSGQIVQESPGGDRDSIEDGRFNGTFRDNQVNQQIQDEQLDGKRKECGGVIVEGLAQVGGPVVKGPPSVQKVIGAAADDPGEGSHAGDHGVISRMPAKVVVAERKKNPDEPRIQKGARGADDSETDDAQDFGAVQAGPGFLSGRG